LGASAEDIDSGMGGMGGMGGFPGGMQFNMNGGGGPGMQMDPNEIFKMFMGMQGMGGSAGGMPGFGGDSFGSFFGPGQTQRPGQRPN